jgi:hypothetical protein
MNNFSWELMVFELNGNRLNDYGAMAVTEKNLVENGNSVTDRKQYNMLTDRLYTPTAGERFDSI